MTFILVCALSAGSGRPLARVVRCPRPMPGARQRPVACRRGAGLSSLLVLCGLPWPGCEEGGSFSPLASGRSFSSLAAGRKRAAPPPRNLARGEVAPLRMGTVRAQRRALLIPRLVQLLEQVLGE